MKSKNINLLLKKELLSCPGESITELLDYTNFSKVKLAKELSISTYKLNKILSGKTPITKRTAMKLEIILGVPASFWINLENTYQKELLEIKKNGRK